MEENKEENSLQDEDFKDFEDFASGEVERPEVEAEEITKAQFEEPTSEHEDALLKEAEMVAKLTQASGFGDIDIEAEGGEEEVYKRLMEASETENQEVPVEPEPTEQPEENKETEVHELSQNEVQPEVDPVEMIYDSNDAVKKYIFYVSRDFVPLIDSLTIDERTAYINDAIQRKIDSEYEYSAIDKKKRILTHIIVMILTFFIVTPIVLFIVHKSIMVTFKNYKYSQDNFEKLYMQRFKNDEAYKRMLQYNKTHIKDENKEENTIKSDK